MATNRWSRRIRLSVAALSVIFASCTEAPVVSAPAVANDLQPSNFYSTYGGSVVSLVDEDDGESYTLNTDTREIRRGSDGAILVLTEEGVNQVIIRGNQFNRFRLEAVIGNGRRLAPCGRLRRGCAGRQVSRSDPYIAA